MLYTRRPLIARVSASVALFACAYLLGYVTHATVSAAEDESPPFAQLTTLARVLSHIDQSYVDPVNDQEMLYGAIKAMVTSLDPHSNFLTPDEFAAMREDTRGEYVGVGMELGVRDEKVTVITAFEGGPAHEAGIQSGDKVIEIDGEVVATNSIEEVVQILRGEQGEPVSLLVHRPIEDTEDVELLSFELIRDVIHVPAVESSLLAPQVGYISVRSFQSGVTDDVRGALDELQIENGSQLTSLVLDFRNNPGGLLNEAVSMSDLFLDEGVVVTTEGRDPEENDAFSSRDGNTAFRGGLVVLVNGGTASASEIVAGAVRDRDRGTIIGTTTFGKGTVQTIIDFADGSGLKLTTARYFTPDHVSIHGAGIEPDLEVASAHIDEVVIAEGFEPVTDQQLLSAVQLLLGETE